MISTAGMNIKNIIFDRGLKQGAIALRAGYKYQTFNNMLNGRKKITDIDIVRIAEALSLTPNDLLKRRKRN